MIFIFVGLFNLTSCMIKKPISNNKKNNIYSIIYKDNGAITYDGYKTTEFIDYKSVVLPKVIKVGYHFDGWYDEDGNKVEYLEKNKNYILEAKYTLINYSIKYNLNGGVLDTSILSYSILSNDIDLNNIVPIKNGYDFVGWSTINKELYLYVYQPLNKDLFFTATSISMSCDFSENGENLHPNNYEIELVSSYDVLCKYIVKDFVVSNEVDRYYNIVCIRRNFDYTYDEKISGTEDDGNEKAIGVGQQWHCY